MHTMNKTKTVSPYFAFILLHSLQIGIGILGYQRVILKNAGYDAWISLIIAGIATHIVLFCMLKMLEKDGDLISIHTTTFGKWIGSIFSVISLFIAYYSALLFFVHIWKSYKFGFFLPLNYGNLPLCFY